MDRERAIWRPNEIPPYEWDAKTRDEQIAWWREANANPETETKPSMLDVPRLYEEGRITLTECFALICKRATDSETADFVNRCPKELLAQVRELLSHYPGNDTTKWPRTLYMASYAPWVTPEEIETSRELEQQAIWNGVALLKSHLKIRG